MINVVLAWVPENEDAVVERFISFMRQYVRTTGLVTELDRYSRGS